MEGMRFENVKFAIVSFARADRFEETPRARQEPIEICMSSYR